MSVVPVPGDWAPFTGLRGLSIHVVHRQANIIHMK